MMPLSMVNEGEPQVIKKVGGKEETRKFLENLGVSKETADQDACRIEHVISAETFDCIKQFARRLQAAHPDKFGDLCE